MPNPSGSVIFYAVLVAPGFVSVMITISLSAIERDLKQFVLLVWSLVTSLFIDTVFLVAYQALHGPVTGLNELSNVFFQPQFRADYVLEIFAFAIAIGFVFSAGVLADVPGKLRSLTQSQLETSYSPVQPWETFMDNAGEIRIKTSDNQLFRGDVRSWSRAQRPRQVRIENPERYYNQGHGTRADFEPVGGPEMIFLEDDIDRVAMMTQDTRLSWFQRAWSRVHPWLPNSGRSDEE